MRENNILKKLLSVFLTAVMLVNIIGILTPIGQVQASQTDSVYSEDFESGSVLTVHSGNGTMENHAQAQGNSYLRLSGLSSTQLATSEILVEVNTEYLLSYRVKVSNVTGNFYFYALGQEWDDSGSYSGLAAVPGAIRAATDGWQTVEATYIFTKKHVQFFFEEAWGGSADTCLDDITLTNKATGEVTYLENFDETKALSVRWGNPTQTQVQEGQPEHYLQLTNASGYCVKTEGISLEANAEYILSYDVKVSNVTGSVYFYAWRQEWDDSGNYTGVLAITEGITATTDGWQTVEASFTAGKNNMQLFFEQAWPGNADICLDNIHLSKIIQEPAETVPPAEEDNVIETSLSFNRVDGTTWHLNANNAGQIAGQYYFATVKVDGSDRKVVFEKTPAGFVIYEGFFTVYGGAAVPQNSFTVSEGTVLYQFNPNVSWNDPISGGQQIEITKTLNVEAANGNWDEYDGTAELDFAQYDYTTVEVGTDGWIVGTTTSNVTVSNGIITGLTGDTADANVLTLPANSPKNLFVMEAGTEYRFSLTYQSAVKLMFFCGDWISLQETASAASDWRTICVTFTPENSGTLPIYIQNWDFDHPEGEFQIKDIYLAKVADTRTVTEGEKLGALPEIDLTPSESGYRYIWGITNDDTDTYTQITEDTLYDKAMGNVIYAIQVRAEHGPDAHWWTMEGASVVEHICSVCGVKEAHTYTGDVCAVCEYDMSQALHFALCDYTAVEMGQGGWDIGPAAGNVKVSDGVISGTTKQSENSAVLSLYQNGARNPYMMEGGQPYRVSLTYRSDVKLMFFCDEWVSLSQEAAAAEDWTTITVTITPAVSRKLAIYVQNWDAEHPNGTFQIKDIYISKLSHSTVAENGNPIGWFPEIPYEPSDEFHGLAWYIKNKAGDGYISVTDQTRYDSSTMGTIVVAKEVKLYHTILNYVRCDLESVDSWIAGSAMQEDSYSSENGILQGKVRANSSGETWMSFSDGANRLVLEPGVEYKVVITYKSPQSFGVFVNLKSNAWVEAPGTCLASTGDQWKTATATFVPTAGDAFYGMLIQSWNINKEYTLQIKDFCIVRSDDSQKFSGNNTLGQLPACERENDVLNRYVYEWVVHPETGEAIVLSGDMTIGSITDVLDDTGMLFAYEQARCIYHMGEELVQAATCTQEGWGPCWQCRNCGKYFSDIMCKTEITDLEAWKATDGKTAPAGHNPATPVMSSDGIVYYYCVCEKLFKADGDGYVEVPLTVLDGMGEKPGTDLQKTEEDSRGIIWLLGISGTAIAIAAGVVGLLLWKGKNTKKHNPTGKKR